MKKGNKRTWQNIHIFMSFKNSTKCCWIMPVYSNKKKYLTRFFLTQIFRVYLYYSSVARILEDKINLYKGNYYLESVSSTYINLCTKITSTIKLLWMQIYKWCCNTYIPIKRTRLMKWVRYESIICDCFTFTQNMQCNNFLYLNKLLGRDSK